MHKTFVGKVTPTWLLPAALFLSKKYSPILFQAHMKSIKMLESSIHAPNTFDFRLFFRDFSDFYVHKACIGEAHLRNW